MNPLVDHAWVVLALDAALETISEATLIKRHFGEKKPDRPTRAEVAMMQLNMTPAARRRKQSDGSASDSDVRRVQVLMQLLVPETEGDPAETGGSSFEWAVYTRIIEQALEGYTSTDGTGHVLEMDGFETSMGEVQEAEARSIQVVALVWRGTVRRDVGSTTTMTALTT